MKAGPCLEHCYYTYTIQYLLIGFIIGLIVCHIINKRRITEKTY